MKAQFLFQFLGLLLALFLVPTADAQTPAPKPAKSEVETLKARIEELEHSMSDEGTLSAETEDLMRLRLELQLPSRLNASFTGLGPGASKVYFSNTPLSIGGYGEFRAFGLNEFGASGFRTSDAKQSGLVNLSPFVGFRFSRELVFNSSYSFTANRVEFAYLDFLFARETGVRVGHVLVPFGLTNLRFEPNLFHQTNRPLSEVLIVPSLWSENGVLGFARFGDLLLQGGIVNGGAIENAEAETWFRHAGTSTSRKNHDLAGVIRAELTGSSEFFMNSNIGASLYYGNSSQDRDELGEAPIFLASLHGELRYKRLTSQLAYTEGTLGNTAEIATVLTQSIGRSARGAHVTLAYDLLDRPPVNDGSQTVDPFTLPVWRELPIFVSWEFANLQADGAEGQAKNEALNSSIWRAGFNFKPHPQIVLKADYAWAENAAGRDLQTAEASLGFAF